MAAATSYTPGLGSATPPGSVSRLTATDGSDMACGYGAGGHLTYRVSAPLYLTPPPSRLGTTAAVSALPAPPLKQI